MKSQPISACVCKAKMKNLGIRVRVGRSAPPAHTGLKKSMWKGGLSKVLMQLYCIGKLLCIGFSLTTLQCIPTVETELDFSIT